MSPKLSQTSLELLPTELLLSIVDNLWASEVRELSLASKRLRNACLPSLFRVVAFQFSHAGFTKIQKLVQSSVRHHIVTITYEIPELLRPCKPLLGLVGYSEYLLGILDFNVFQSRNLHSRLLRRRRRIQ